MITALKLPIIPLEKIKYSNNQTKEREIISKLIKNEMLTEGELKSYDCIIAFYKELNSCLKSINYAKLTKGEVLYICDYIRKVYYYNIHFNTRVSFKNLYRVVINKNILGTNDSIIQVKHLGSPPLDLIKKKRKYNRANSPMNSVFYCTSDIQTAIFELGPTIGDKITISEWSPLNYIFNFHIIFDNSMAKSPNFASNIIKTEHDKYMSNRNFLLKEFFFQYFELIGREFSKKIEHNNEYIVSATLSDIIFENDSKSGNNIDGILYPSIKNRLSNNLALKDRIVMEKLSLKRVIEFVITETYYELVWNENFQHGATQKTLVKYEGYRETINIDNRRITW